MYIPENQARKQVVPLDLHSIAQNSDKSDESGGRALASK